MPQTREHIAILDLLQVRSAVVALSKSDTIDDPEWLDLMSEEVRKELAPTALSGARIIPVSARTRAGLDDLKAELDDVLGRTPARPDWARARLPVDRVFTIAGFGTVTTGTLLDGSLDVGQEVEIQPTGLKARIRGLQTHKEKVTSASPGRRLAINLSGVSPEQVKRGDVVAAAGTLAPTQLIDVRLRWLSDAPTALTHNTQLEFYSGAFQSLARVRLLGDKALAPGKEGWAQLALQDPAALERHDRFILRQPSPSITVGGGFIVDAHPVKRYRRFKAEIMEKLERIASGSAEDVLLETLTRVEPISADELFKQSSLTRDTAQAVLQALLAQGQVIRLNEYLLMSLAGWHALLDKLRTILGRYHAQFPLRAGMPREELKSRLGLGAKWFELVVARAAGEQLVVESAMSVRLSTHSVTFSASQQPQVGQLLSTLQQHKFSPPSYDECVAIAGADVFNALIEQGMVVRVSDGVVFSADAYQEMVEGVRAHLLQQGTITVAQVRDMFNASRKYALGLMEHLDDIKLTRRVGDERVLR